MSKATQADVETDHDNQLTVYRRRDTKTGKLSDCYYYDIIIPRQKRIRFRSTKHTKKLDAIMYAKTQYAKVSQRIIAGIDITFTNFTKVAEKAIEHYEGRVEIGTFSQRDYDRIRTSNTYIFTPYFEMIDKDFHTITKFDIEKMVIWRKKQGILKRVDKRYKRVMNEHKKRYTATFEPWDSTRKVSNATVNKELQALRYIYKFAEDAKYISSREVPKITNIQYSVAEHRREHFTEQQWSEVTEYLRTNYAPWNEKVEKATSQAINIGDEQNVFFAQRASHFMCLLQRHFWLLLSQSSTRVGELRKIKWQDITDRPYPKPKTGKIINRKAISVNGKTGPRIVICMPYANKTIERWKNICAAFRVTTKPNEYVFRHPYFCYKNKGTPNNVIMNNNSAFQRVLEKLDLLHYGKTDQNGKLLKRTQYSIRHSAITWRLTAGVNLQALSSNVGSSIETLMRSYDHSTSLDYMEEITKNDPTDYD